MKRKPYKEKNRKKKNLNILNKKKKIVILLLLIILNHLYFSKDNSKINFQKLIPFIFKRTKIKLKLNPDEIIYMGERKLMKDVINSYLLLITDKYKVQKDREAKKLYNYLFLKNVSEEPNLLNEIRKSLLNVISRKVHKNFSQIDTVFLTHNSNFGNSLACLNNLIYYCEILGCKNITLNKNNTDRRNWHIKNPIISKKPKLTIQLGTNIDCNEKNTACMPLYSFFFPFVARFQLRFNVIKDEILRNIPKLVTEPNDLYIHFRTGNIFRISNKIINELINKYPKIIYKRNNLDVDIAYLSYAYNIVGSTSSFLCSIIKLNDNLKYLWEYDIYRFSEKIYHLHYHIFNFPNTFTIYSMRPTDFYRNELFVWKHSPYQIKLMHEDKCPYDFITFKSNYDIS